MTRIKLADLTDPKPVRISIDLPARLHRDLQAYAVAINGGKPDGAPPLDKLIAPMLERFIAADRGFVRPKP